MRALALFFIILAGPALADDQIDYLLKFSNSATAIKAAQISGFWDAVDAGWSGAQVIAPVQIWQTTAIAGDGTETRIVQAGYWMLVSTDGRNATIEGCACLQLAADRTLAATGAPAATWLLANNTGVAAAVLGRATLPTWHIEPMFAGSQQVYRFGGH